MLAAPDSSATDAESSFAGGDDDAERRVRRGGFEARLPDHGRSGSDGPYRRGYVPTLLANWILLMTRVAANGRTYESWRETADSATVSALAILLTHM